MECTFCSALLEERNLFFLLNCGHHICQSCVNTTTKSPQSSELKCLQCNADTKLNGLTKSLLVYLMMAADPIQCPNLIHYTYMIGEEHPAPKSMYCLNCKDTLRADEAKSHHRHLESSKHVLITLDEIHQYQQSKAHQRHLGFLHPKSCMHHNRPFEFLDLETESHNRLVCSKCECVSEDQASLSGLVDGASSLLHQKLEHIRELGCEGAVHLEELMKEEVSFNSRLKGLQESRDRSLSEIRRVFGSLHEALQTRQSELERDVEELTKSAKFALSEERERCSVWQGQLSLLGKCVEEIQMNPPPFPSASSSLSSTDTHSSDLLNHIQKELMVDVCLLEDALRSSLSSSRASSSLTDVQSQLRVSKIRDQLKVWFDFTSLAPSLFPSSLPNFSVALKEEDNLDTLLHLISIMFSVTSTSSSPPPPPSDWSQNKVQSVMTFCSKGKGVDDSFRPWGMTYSPDSKLFYVSDYNEKRIQVFRNHPREGRMEIEFLSLLLPPSDSYYFRPFGICYHDGQLFIADQSSGRVHVWRSEDGSLVRMIGTRSGSPTACTVYQNHLFVSEYDNHCIQKFSLSDFSVVKVIGSEGRGLGQLTCPRDLSVFNGKLYVVDSGNKRVSVFDPESGAGLSVIGPSHENLSSPMSLCFSQNLLFVSNQRRISVFDSDHNYLYSFESHADVKYSSLRDLLMVDDKLYVNETDKGSILVFEQRLD